jgi:hypothetical protein
MSKQSVTLSVECSCCHRQERWNDGDLQVLLEGGQRLPAVHPHLAAWRTLHRSMEGTLGPVLGTCSLCSQPLVAPIGTAQTSIPWTIDTSKGSFLITQEIEGPEGAVSKSDFDSYLNEEYKEIIEFQPGQTLFTMTLLSFMTVPIILWVLTGIAVATILLNFTSSTQVFVPAF